MLLVYYNNVSLIFQETKTNLIRLKIDNAK